MLQHTASRIKVAIINEGRAMIATVITISFGDKGMLGRNVCDHFELRSWIFQPVVVVFFNLGVNFWVDRRVSCTVENPDAIILHIGYWINCTCKLCV